MARRTAAGITSGNANDGCGRSYDGYSAGRSGYGDWSASTSADANVTTVGGIRISSESAIERLKLTRT
jgi:hypothetical protein